MHFHVADQFQDLASPIHRLEPRVKLVLTTAVVLALSLLAEGKWWGFALIGAIVLTGIFLARLNLGYIWSRSVIVLPFVLAAAALPFTVPGPELARLPVLGWVVSETGGIRFLSILLRSWIAVQAAILLTATTRFDLLLWALARLGLPRILVATLGFMYRYLFLLGDEALRLLRARSARSAVDPSAGRPSLLWQGRVAGHLVGSLFIRSLERSERIYAAMLARGYDGRVRLPEGSRLSGADRWVMVGGLLCLGSIVWVARGG